MCKPTFLLLCILLSSAAVNAQELPRRHFLEAADTFDRTRFRAWAAAGTALYAGAAYGLYQIWYKDYELTGFHTFNDLGEWENMDKVGHMVTAYNQSQIAFRGALWTGMERRRAMWLGVGIGSLLQSTVEVMDGFSAKWGFSWADIGFNTLGVGLFAGQEIAWGEQRISFKLSNTRPDYSDELFPSTNGGPAMSPRARAYELYGRSFGEALIKDYNGQTLWASVNLASFSQNQRADWLPGWLNLAVGYGAENMFGGYGNAWQGENGASYRLDEKAFPRYRQFYLSFDVDLQRIPSKNRLVKSLLGALNWVKIPAPALEVNTNGGVKFHPVYW